MKKNVKKISMILLFAILINLLPVKIIAKGNQGKEILVLGEDLSPQMVAELKTTYGIDYPIEELIITNKEEHEALGNYISADVITNKSMSSAHIKLLEEGEGIWVKTKNINWVSEDMYRNALTTAGIKDAEVYVAATFPVSGTAALTGSMKAYEKLTGEKISEEEKDVANEELITTAELSDEIGQDNAEKIITEVKIFIIENNITDKDKILEAIESVAEDMNLDLSEETKEEIANLMVRIGKLDLDVDVIKDQISNIIDKLEGIDIDPEEVKGFFSRLLDSIKNFFNKIFG